jgi:hypothetical protein
MDFEKQKSILLDKIRADDDLSAELKDDFEKQVAKMNEDEFAIFLESIKEAGNGDDLKKRVSRLEELEGFSHNDFLQIASKFSSKVTKNEVVENRISDDREVDVLLDKIDSL